MGEATRTSAKDSNFTLDGLVDEKAEKHPERIWASIAQSTDLAAAAGWRHITYQQLGHAINGFARFVVQNTAAASDDAGGAVVAAYIGVNDELHFVATCGLIKAGCKAMLPSPRNSPENTSALFDSTGCTLLFHDQRTERAAAVIETARPHTTTLMVPSFDDLVLEGERSGHFRSRAPSGPGDQILVLHTSGSTGTPKPVFLTNGFVSLLQSSNTDPPPRGRRSAFGDFVAPHGKFFSMAPPYHMMGFVAVVRTLLAADNLILTAPDRPPNAAAVAEILRETQPGAGVFAPSLLEEVGSTAAGLEALASVQHIFFGGGPLAQQIGDRLCTLTQLHSLIGSTEAGFLQCLVVEDPLDWPYFEWAPAGGIVMEPAGDGLSEMTIQKRGDGHAQGVFHTFPSLEVWRTNDLFAPHPKKAGLWTYKGRNDDVIVLSNGEKLNPVGFEKDMESHPLVRGAVVVGQARFQTALIIEPAWESVPGDMDPTQLVEDLWPTVEGINKTTPGHGRVWKSMVIVSKRDKPFQRAAKGSIIRKLTVVEYTKEIDALYGNESVGDKLGKIDLDAGMDATKAFIRRVVEAVGVPLPPSAPDNADIFGFGVDSLQVVALSKALASACSEIEQADITPQVIYRNPTIAALARYLTANGEGESGSSREAIMAAMIANHTKGLQSMPRPAPSSSSSSHGPKTHTVVLTGSTGALGNYILQSLIDSPQVSKIYCLNRSADAEVRNRSSFQDRGIPADFAKVSFLRSDFSKDNFDLSPDVYRDLLRGVDIFVHNAWAVDFNKTVASFEDTHIAGTRRVIDFSAYSKRRAQVVFISSVAAVGNWRKPDAAQAVPEHITDDHSVPSPQGYGESKHVAEVMLSLAARHANVPATIIRCGQLAGPSDARSVWNRHEWLPSLLISSRAMGKLPRTLGNQNLVDWMPMDIAAKAIFEVAMARSDEIANANSNAKGFDEASIRAFHLVNPRAANWTDLAPAVLETLRETARKDVELVRFEDWLAALRRCPATAEEMEAKPALKLLDFYEGLAIEGGGAPRLATEETERISAALRGVGAIDGPLLQAWIQMW
jgi:thioester reductase-like protein/acyl-coenzyme A synthetase/AMP-(fatty) acid ligase